MHLENFPKVRIQKYEKGYVVEMEKRTWYGKRYWVHIESTSGIKELPWHYKTLDSAVEEATKHFKWDLYHGTAMYSDTEI